MALRMPVKLGRVTNLSDARYGAGMGVSYLAFPINQGIELQAFKEIAGWVSGPALVAEVSDPAAPWLPDLPEVIFQCPVTLLPQADRLPRGKWIVQGSGPALAACLDELRAHRDRILFLDLANTEAMDEAILNRLMQAFPVWVPPGNQPIDALMARGFAGLSLEGFAEERAGFKDYGPLAAVLESLEVDS